VTEARSKKGHKGFLTKHGKWGSPVHLVWLAMKQRCANPNSKSYKWYGARGIAVCQRWAESFEAFAEDMGPRPEGAQIERIDNDGPYSPDNCRWASHKEQMQNTRAGAILEVNGQRRKVKEWAALLGVPVYLVRQRIAAGWTADRAVSAPPRYLKRGRAS